MNKRAIKTIGSTTILSLVLSAAVPAVSAEAAGSVTSVEGADSYETAALAATSNWTDSENVLLVSGEGYADALSSVALSKQLDAPILLTGGTYLNSSAKAALDKLKPKNIYIIGGTGVISQAIRNQLRDENYNLIELYGGNRYDTNASVAEQLVKLGVDPSNVLMAGGGNFSDTLSAAPVAAAKGQILLLGGNDRTSMSSVADFVDRHNSAVTVVGTSNTISDDTYKSLGAVARINGGADRFATNLNVLKAFDGSLKSDKIYVANASGARYADSLIAASLAGINSSPLVIVNGEGDAQTGNALDYIRSKASGSTEVNIISEKGVISDATVSDIKNAAAGIANDSSTVNSVAAVGLNQIKVVFNTAVDESSAERIANYEIDGSSLGSEAQTQSSAYLQDDGRTVVITFKNPFKQGKKVNFTVKNNVLSDELSSSITEYEKEVTFQETGSPSIESVTPVGGNKLRVKFSEAVRMDEDDLASMKINNRSVRNYGLDTSDTEFKDKSGDWSDGVDLYFNSTLPVGSNTFTIPDGTSGSKFDNAANIPIQSQSKNFTVESVYGAPKVESVTSDNAGTIYIKYNRAMDQETALDPDNYEINGDDVDVDESYVTFEPGSGDSTVRIKNVGDMLEQGTNTVLVKDDVQDTFYNTINQTSTTLYYGSSSEKPEVASSNILDEETIRVKFNKDVVRSYATNTGNYKLMDSDGNDISYKLNNVNTITVDGNNNRTFDLKFDDGTLNGSKYTLTVKNIIDTEAKPNVMTTYTATLSGMDSKGVSVTEIVKRFDNDQAVAIFFNHTMDDASISDKSNYVFRDGTGEVKNLPGGAIVTPSYDDKSVTVEFPSNYTIGEGTTARNVIQVGVENVVDQDGTPIDLGSYIGDISTTSSNGPKIISGTAEMTFSGDDISVKVSLSGALDSLDLNDFKVDGYKPDNAYSTGNDVILIYKSGVKDGEKVEGIKDCGESTTLSVVNNNSMDSAGRNIRTGSTKVYIPPITRSNQFTATNASNADTVKVVFNQDIDTAIQSQYSDDFIFTDVSTGRTVTPNAISVDGKTVIYRFNAASFDKGDVIKIAANSSGAGISIRSEKHEDAAYTIYSPSGDDLSGYTVTAK
ncbi:MAG: cell wall-binding repeat-containing protein [Clostridium sp.]|uniref:cell wall-binding repeat-containing protein n=1 Tax=Clostridium sp. TaxID=1506 RepID=UPI0025B89F3C|nr:cell wall-binding repeat-containing protein [Clostridium sp.]MCH3965031.1 cell wall-binding repeat-containing protein [Clostridium sp.]MCI1714252.1 cell wall-binding repeat-containing protein [Clostridium sp.]MCI1798514.1 cell wall-binding repeat-containing protein [Clostridium sp.]MCI1812755.1 cell wall-binding repeat-containing protein [Clostridium sp.]MCI1869323.1 cell wall-binding repeat-containing protein [Clostridium sp.]